MTTIQTTQRKVFPSNFRFSDLFKNISVPNLDDFIFDNVTLSLNSNKISFSGDLRMTGPLTIFKDYLGNDATIVVSGSIQTSSTDLDSKIELTNFSLTSTETFFKQIFTGVTLTKVFFELQVNKPSGTWEITPQITGDFDVDNLTDKHSDAFSLSVQASEEQLHLRATAHHLKGAFDYEHLILENVTVTGNIGDSAQSLDFSADYSIGTTTFNFAGEISEEGVGGIASASSFNLSTLGLIFNEIAATRFSSPDFGVEFENSSLSLATTDLTINGQTVKQGLSLASEVTVHGYSFQANAEISLSGVKFDGALGELSFGPVDLKKTELDFQFYKASMHKPAKFGISGEAEIEGLTLDCGVYFEKNAEEFDVVLYANINATSFGLSNIFPAVKNTFVDSLRFSKVGFIYASANTTTQNEGVSYDVKEGLQLMGVLEEIPELSNLTGESHVGLILAAHFGETTDISVAIPDTRIHFGHSITTDPFKIQINIEPIPSLELIFGMDVDIPNQSTPLHFDMSLLVNAEEADAAVTMKNYWKNAFGIRGVNIGPGIALQLDINYEQFASTGFPSGFALAGGLEIGDTVAQMAVSISENPMEEILVGKLDRLSPSQLIEFAARLIDIHIHNIPDFFYIKNLDLYCAPAGGSIGTIVYQPGFSFAGDIVIAGEEISLYTRISDTGIEGRGDIQNLSFGPLKITGEEGKDAQIDLELTAEEQSLLIDGAIEFLGFKEGVYVKISNHGVAFKFEMDFSDTLTFEIEGASSGSLDQPESLDFTLSGEMENDITSYLETKVTENIHNSLKTTDDNIAAAKRKVAATKKAFDNALAKANNTLSKAQVDADVLFKNLSNDLASTKSTFGNKISKAEAAVADAEAKYNHAFNKAKAAVNTAEIAYNNGIIDAQNKLNAAERTYNNGITVAQRRLNDAERDYNNAIGSAIRAVQNASRKVDALNHWYSYPAYLVAKGVLAVAKEALELVKYGTKYTAFLAAKTALKVARTGGNYIAFKSAETALDVAKTGAKFVIFNNAKATLDVVREGTEFTVWQAAKRTLSFAKSEGRIAITAASNALENIGSSAAYLALSAAKLALKVVQNGPEKIAFDAANAALTAAKLGADDILKLEAYIAKHAGDLVDIKSFTFSGSLKAIEEGDFFDAKIDISLLKHDYIWDFDFNVKNINDFIDALFKKAFNELKSLAKKG